MSMLRRLGMVHPFCTHYTAGLFDELARRMDVHFYFFSDGNDWFWQKEHGIFGGRFSHEYLSGFRLGGSRIVPGLLWKLLRRRSDATISSVDGRYCMPLAYLAARLTRTPFLLWTGIWFPIETPFHRLVKPITRYFYRHADAVIVYGDHVKRFLIAEGVDENRIFIARHSVDNTYYSRRISELEKADLRGRLGISAEKKVVLFLGRLEEVKGVRYLIEAFAQLSPKDAVLVIAGEGAQRSALETLSRARCVPGSVLFTGYVPIEASVTFYGIADVCVIPSISTPEVKELWGLVTNEAFNQGVSVIATDAVGAVAGGFVRDGVNGVVVPEKDSASIANALSRILGDDEMRGKLSSGARETVAESTHQRMADAFVAALEHAMTPSKKLATEPKLTRQNAQFSSNALARCPFCEGAETPSRLLGAFRRCGSCGLLFRDPMPTSRDLESLYKQSWGTPKENVNETGGTTEELAEIYAQRLMTSLGRRDLRGLRILEYGAGRGEFLAALSRRGAEVFALEPYGRDHLLQRGFTAYSSVEELPKAFNFDGIVTIDVVEHEFAAWHVLRELRTRLVASGWIYVATPNPAGLNARIHGGRWREAQKPGHLLFFPPRTLERVLQAAGFERLRRLRWNVTYGGSLLRRMKSIVLSALRLDGELRYIAFQPDERRT